MSTELALQSHRQHTIAPPRSAELLRAAVYPLADQDGEHRAAMSPAAELAQRHAFSQVPARASDACPLTPQRCPFGGACHNCPLRVQAKLTISQPGDKYEEEADRVADQVMSMPEPQVQRACPNCDEEETAQTKPLADQITPLVQRQAAPEEEEEPVQTKPLVQRQAAPEQEDEEEESVQTKPLVQRQAEKEQEEEEPVQLKATTRQPTTVLPTLATQIQSLRGGGQPLPAATRAFFEPRFGRDFSGVRMHTDAHAAATARSLGARAYTMGRDVVFGAGEYAGGVGEGRRLLAHELAHVVQQGGVQLRSSQSLLRISRSGNCIQRQKSSGYSLSEAKKEFEKKFGSVNTRNLTQAGQFFFSDQLLRFLASTKETTEEELHKLKEAVDTLDLKTITETFRLYRATHRDAGYLPKGEKGIVTMKSLKGYGASFWNDLKHNIYNIREGKRLKIFDRMKDISAAHIVPLYLYEKIVCGSTALHVGKSLGTWKDIDHDLWVRDVGGGINLIKSKVDIKQHMTARLGVHSCKDNKIEGGSEFELIAKSKRIKENRPCVTHYILIIAHDGSNGLHYWDPDVSQGYFGTIEYDSASNLIKKEVEDYIYVALGPKSNLWKDYNPRSCYN